MPEPTNPQDAQNPQAATPSGPPGDSGASQAAAAQNPGTGGAPGGPPTAPLPSAGPPTQPLPPGPPPAQPPRAAHAAQAAGAPPPGKPGLWKQATSTTGGLIAVILAGGLVAVLLLGLLGTGLFVAARVIAHENRGDRIEQVREGRGELPPGQRKQLEKQAPGPRTDGPGRHGGLDDGLGPLMRSAMALGNVQHGEFTATDEAGKAVVMTLQRGEATKVSATSISVKSADNFAGTYAVGADTRGRAGDVAVGDTVIVVAEKAGAKAVLVTVVRRG